MLKPTQGFKTLAMGAVLLFLSSLVLFHGPRRSGGGTFGMTGNLWSRHLRNKDKMLRPWAHKGTIEPSHVRVVVRTQPREELLLRSLIYCLRAQAQGMKGVRLDFVLVPTEAGSLSLYQKLQKGT